MKRHASLLTIAIVALAMTLFVNGGCGPEDIIDDIIIDNTDTIDSLYQPVDSIPEGWTELGELRAKDMIWGLAADLEGNIYAGGYFTDAQGYRDVVKWDGSHWTHTRLNANENIFAMTSDAWGNIYAVGQFTDAAIPTAGNPYVAKWNGSSWSNIGGRSGTFLTADNVGNVYNGVQKWDGNDWSTLCFDTLMGGVDGYSTYAISARADGMVQYAAGNFQNYEGYRYVARCDGSEWTTLGAPFANGDIMALAQDGSGNVYAAGNFTDGLFSGEGNKYVAYYNGSVWQTLGDLGSNSLNPIYYLAYNPLNGRLYASGSFYTQTGDTHYTITEWNGSTWTPVGNMQLDPAPILIDRQGHLISVFSQLQQDGTVRFCVVRKD